MNTNNSNVPNIAVIAFAFALAAVVVTLCAICWRDGNNPLVSQAMQELVYIAGVAVLVLGGLLGYSKYLDNKGASTSSAAAAAVATTTATDPIGDLPALLAAYAQQQQQEQQAVAVPVPVTSSTSNPGSPVAGR